MSLYNIVFGQNPLSDFLLGLLNMTRDDVGRFRDVFVEKDQIAVYTRNGGGNRQCVHDEDFCVTGYPGDRLECDDKFCRKHNEIGEDCKDPGCYACIIEHRLPKHPLYIKDRDDDFDCTYATIYFKFPEEHKDLLLKLVSGKFEPDKRWAEALDALKKGKRPDVEAKMWPVVEKINEALKKGDGGVIEV